MTHIFPEMSDQVTEHQQDGGAGVKDPTDRDYGIDKEVEMDEDALLGISSLMDDIVMLDIDEVNADMANSNASTDNIEEEEEDDDDDDIISIWSSEGEYDINLDDEQFLA